MRAQYHFRDSAAGLRAWNVHRLVELSSALVRERVPLSSIRELDEAYWAGGENQRLTCREIVDHARLMLESDLAFPVILSSDGRVIRNRTTSEFTLTIFRTTGSLLRRQKLHASQVFHGLESIIGGHQHMILETHCQFQRKRVCVGDIPVHFNLGSAHRTLTADGNNLCLAWKNGAENSPFLRRAKPLPQVSSNLAPLHG
jgi:hypothetical protein